MGLVVFGYSNLLSAIKVMKLVNNQLKGSDVCNFSNAQVA
jgi:hypothetical protein